MQNSGRSSARDEEMIKDKKTIFILLAALLAILIYFHAVVKEMVNGSFVDFTHYWINASLLKEGYNVWKKDECANDKITEILKEAMLPGTPAHSPGFFIFILPFTFFSLRLAAFLWLVLGHLLLLFSILLILKIVKTRPSLEDMLITLFLVFSFWPIREDLHLGQPNFLILFFLAASLFLLKKNKMLWAGILLGLAINMREYLAVLGLLFLWKRNWRALSGIILGFLFIKVAAGFLFGWITEVSYWERIFFTFGKRIYFPMTNLSLIALVYRIGKDLVGITVCRIIILLIMSVLIGQAFFYTRKKEGDVLLEFSLFLVLTFLVSPWVHEAHYVALYPAIVITWFYLI
jgi:hypothetical protein